jgi:hypothetical protein
VSAQYIHQVIAGHSDPRDAVKQVQHTGLAHRIFKVASKQVFLKSAIGGDAAWFISFRSAAKL